MILFLRVIAGALGIVLLVSTPLAEARRGSAKTRGDFFGKSMLEGRLGQVAASKVTRRSSRDSVSSRRGWGRQGKSTRRNGLRWFSRRLLPVVASAMVLAACAGSTDASPVREAQSTTPTTRVAESGPIQSNIERVSPPGTKVEASDTAIEFRDETGRRWSKRYSSLEQVFRDEGVSPADIVRIEIFVHPFGEVVAAVTLADGAEWNVSLSPGTM